MYTRKLRITGETLTVARPEEIGADTSEGKWVTFCEDHKTLVYSATEKLAYYTHGRDFCDDCRAEVEGTATPEVEAAPLATVHEFSNEKDAKAFAKAQGGPVQIHIERIKRGLWMVDITSK